mgnify:CR=1 FL=1
MQLPDLGMKVEHLLEQIQQNIYQKALDFRERNMIPVDSWDEFKQKIEGIVEAFTAMQDQVNRERRAMEKNWKEREKQIERVIKNTVGLYGDMQGIIGGQIPHIPALELGTEAVKALPEEAEVE